jgi:hypothetical protein
MTQAMFVRRGEHYLPTELAESPWGAGMLHGGPPAALLARAIEQGGEGAGLQVARLTVDLFSPVPTSALAVETQTLREGRRIKVIDATLLSGGAPASVPWPRPPGPEGLASGRLGPPQEEGRTWRQGFHSHVEIRRAPPAHEAAPAVAWFRIPFPLVEGEPITPLQRLAATCDFVHGTSNGGRRNSLEFINVDSTISIQRLPAGEWIGLQSQKAYEESGIGVASALVWDEEGLVGRATQSILTNPGRRS